MEHIYEMCEEISGQIKLAGCVADTKGPVFDLEEEEKEVIVEHHSEKLATAFGFTGTAPITLQYV
uniref:DYW domain-containing protein n=1 Tax=Nymphaea colorata TaxID=210225 RepID=A0A5K1GLC8_9MAGN